jgi:hypothetical protein
VKQQAIEAVVVRREELVRQLFKAEGHATLEAEALGA